MICFAIERTKCHHHVDERDARRKKREESGRKLILMKKKEKCKREDVDVKPCKYANFLVKVKEEPYICNLYGQVVVLQII